MKKLIIAILFCYTQTYSQIKLEVIDPPKTSGSNSSTQTTTTNHTSNTGSITNNASANKNLGRGLGNDVVVDGLREALTLASQNAGNKAGLKDGFFKNNLIKIPFPPEIKDIEKTVRTLGMSKQADKFIESLNRAAEDAAKKAAPIFINAVKGMSIQDGLSILQGGNDGATQFLKTNTQTELSTAFAPVVKNSLSKTQVTKYWKDVAKTYNKVPFAKPINPDLEKYVTERAISGLFTLVAQEELKIRQDPMGQASNLLQTLFGGK
ncbi:MAG TPA: DUF4197 domain-containing protein [Bacteroidia bacterium]|nr:DUF4197 domain-containing protein [Bacteroidia bacterium]